MPPFSTNLEKGPLNFDSETLFLLSEGEDLKLKLATHEADWQLKNQDTLIAQMGFQTEKLSQEKTIADAEELKDKSRRWLQRRHSRKLPHMAIGFFSKRVSNCLSDGEYLLSWRDIPRTQNMWWITAKF
ncbi:hypothetical protein IHE44_0000322 [Lamprotornis superbus]|uniref:Dynein heavy chain coiled coil stalk domain-containing protein n=1 Tax=Lamprotornis superbus TaxID=245042 RepID=A0A835U162_9PASS|nr:hypothetical protein IHE44_0000322 [Lamprotornis superbus]